MKYLLLLPLLLCCAKIEVQIEADNAWTGIVAGASVSGNLDKTFNITDDNDYDKYAIIQSSNQFDGGTLRAKIVKTWILGETIYDEKVTHVANGIVIVRYNKDSGDGR